jgi:hypothetical protein
MVSLPPAIAAVDNVYTVKSGAAQPNNSPVINARYLALTSFVRTNRTKRNPKEISSGFCGGHQ